MNQESSSQSFEGKRMLQRAEGSRLWAYRDRRGSQLDEGLVLLDNVQFIYELALAQLELQIYTLDKLLTQVKHEFNASNKELYTDEALLAKGKIT